MTELCEVVITAPDPGWLKDFSRELIEQRLCASAHNYAPVQSIYRWCGEIYERTEGRVSLHSRPMPDDAPVTTAHGPNRARSMVADRVLTAITSCSC